MRRRAINQVHLFSFTKNILLVATRHDKSTFTAVPGGPLRLPQQSHGTSSSLSPAHSVIFSNMTRAGTAVRETLSSKTCFVTLSINGTKWKTLQLLEKIISLARLCEEFLQVLFRQ